MRGFVSRGLAALLSAVSVTAAEAQSSTFVQTPRLAQFGEDFQIHDRIEGFSAAEYAEAKANIFRVVDVLRAMPAVNSPPPLVCTRLLAFVPLLPVHGRIETEIGVGLARRDGDGCYSRSEREYIFYSSAVTIHVNRADKLFQRLGESFSDDAGAMLTVVPTAEFRGHPVYRTPSPQCCIAVADSREPLFLPVSGERYQRAVIRDFEARVASAEKSQPKTMTVKKLEEWRRSDKPKYEAAHAKNLDQHKQMGATPEILTDLQAKYEKFIAGLEATLLAMAEGAEKGQQGAAAMRQKSVDVNRTALEKARRDLTGLSSAERSGAACLGQADGGHNGVALRPCADGLPHVVTMNPHYFDPRRRSALRLLVIPAVPVTSAVFSDPMKMTVADAQLRILAALDLDALAQLLR